MQGMYIGLTPLAYELEARSHADRELRARLRKARERAAYHGRHSYMAREARKEIAALEAEMRVRNLKE